MLSSSDPLDPSVLSRPPFVLHHLRFFLLSWRVSVGLKWSRAGGSSACLCFLTGSLNRVKRRDCKERASNTGGDYWLLRSAIKSPSYPQLRESVTWSHSSAEGSISACACARSPRKRIKRAELGFWWSLTPLWKTPDSGELADDSWVTPLVLPLFIILD